MLAHIQALHAAVNKAARTLFHLRFALVAAGASLLLAGCLQAPLPPLAGKDPSDPRARVPRVGYRPVLGSYASRRPVEPTPWREQNERVAPAEKR